MDDEELRKREEERRKRREERERQRKLEEEAWELERKKREEERNKRRAELARLQLLSEESSGSASAESQSDGTSNTSPDPQPKNEEQIRTNSNAEDQPPTTRTNKTKTGDEWMKRLEEEERKKREDAERQRIEDEKRKDEGNKRNVGQKASAWVKMVEEEERRKKEEVERLQREKEETRRRELEKKKKEESAAEEWKRKEEEDRRIKEEEDKKRKEEEEKRKKELDEKRKQKEEEERRREEMKRIQEEQERKQREEEEALEEERRREQKKKREEEEAREEERRREEKKKREELERKRREEEEAKRKEKEEERERKRKEMDEKRKREESEREEELKRKKEEDEAKQRAKEEEERKERQKKRIQDEDQRAKNRDSISGDETGAILKAELEKNGVPAFITLRDKKQKIKEELQVLRKKLDMFDNIHQLRRISASYTVQFIQTLQSLLEGDSYVSYSSLKAQTLDEESADQGDFSWTLSRREQEFDLSKVPNASSKLVGAQQLKRLIHEFRCVVQQLRLTNVTLDDVRSSIYRNRVTRQPNYVWGACDIAKQRTEEYLKPLIAQFCSRTVYLLKRYADCSQLKVEGSEFPFLSQHVKNLTYDFVDKMAAQFSEQCAQEFYQTPTIYWSFSLNNQKKCMEKDVVAFATEIFTEIRDRILKKSIMTMCDCFIFSVLEKRYGLEDIQTELGTASESELKHLFEVSRHVQAIEKLEDEQQEELWKLEDQEILIYGQSMLPS